MLRNGSRIILPVGIQRFLTTTTGSNFFARTKKSWKAIYFRQAAGINSMDTLSMFRWPVSSVLIVHRNSRKIPPRPFSSRSKKRRGIFNDGRSFANTRAGVGKESSSTRVSSPALITFVAERIRGDITPLQRRY